MRRNVKRLGCALLLGVAGLTGCATDTSVHTVGPNRYLICDDASMGDCKGANPEKGIKKVCLPWGRPIASVTPTRGFGQGVIVMCGER